MSYQVGLTDPGLPTDSEAGMWKRLNFRESRSTLKKEVGSESELESI